MKWRLDIEAMIIPIVVAICIVWWAFLFITTQVVIVFDSVGYEDLGRLIYTKGFAGFFSGLQREPLFPAMIAASMRLGDWLGISYYYPLKMMGLGCLALTMAGMYRLMLLLSVRRWVAGLVLLYMGASPVVTNSSMRVWSEFAVYPWVVVAVWWSAVVWEQIRQGRFSRHGKIYAMWQGTVLGFFFLMIMSVKAVAEGVLVFYLAPFYVQLFLAWKAKDFKMAKQVVFFLIGVMVVFQGTVMMYKAVNYHNNGHFAFTNRGDWALYGNTVRRMEPLTMKSLGAAITFVPGMGLCHRLWGIQACDFWSARYSDDLIGRKQEELKAQGLTEAQMSRYFVSESAKAILSHPLQALLLMGVEAHKMFWWESSFAFVAYPNWLEAILYNPVFSNTLRTVMGFLSWAGFMAALFVLCRRCKKWTAQDWVLLWVMNFVVWYMAVYSFFFVLDRYAFPIISLFLILIAVMAEKMISWLFTMLKGIKQTGREG